MKKVKALLLILVFLLSFNVFAETAMAAVSGGDPFQIDGFRYARFKQKFVRVPSSDETAADGALDVLADEKENEERRKAPFVLKEAEEKEEERTASGLLGVSFVDSEELAYELVGGTHYAVTGRGTVTGAEITVPPSYKGKPVKTCKECGRPFFPKSGHTKYCPSCVDVVRRRKVAASARKSRAKN